ncbi:MAG: response regulator transcription factor [Oscillospiraceae bacterium]|jgi:DNA-binding response OmpR family regulator|nr:response regulator transcription factor [Oscillospiraceae bacterium]
MVKILIVDDEAKLRRLVGDCLRREGYEVLEADNGKSALDAVTRTGGLSLVVMDVMMPVMDGITALREIRGFSKIPVLMLTAKSEEEDELDAFTSGTDDYLTKPFSLAVLQARIRALLKRGGEAEAAVYTAGGITLDTRAYTVKCNGEPAELTPKEFEFLLYFMKNKGIALSREQILNSVWNYDFFGDARTIDTHVKNMRTKLGACGELIKTVRGHGYKLEE